MRHIEQWAKKKPTKKTKKKKKTELGLQSKWPGLGSWPFVNCMTLGEFLNLSISLFPIDAITS